MIDKGGQGRHLLIAVVAAGLPLALAVGLTLVAYAGALSAGFMFDDPMDLPRASGRSLVQIFTDAAEWKYYRPLPLALWKALYELLGRHDPVVLHALVLAAHALNGWLVYHLARRLTDRAGGLLAAALFLWYPLSAQVVGYVVGLFHALGATGVLAAALLYWDARLQAGRIGARLRLTLALLAGAAGMLSHENGLVVVAAVLLVEGVLRVTGRVPRLSWAPAWFAAEAVGFLALWWLVPRQPADWALDLTSLKMNGLYFLQGLVSPVAGQLNDLPRWGGSDNRTLALVGALALAALVLLLVVRRRWLALGFGLAWFAAAALPSWALLPWSYVEDAPRLLYLSSVGAALLWGAALAPVATGLAYPHPGPLPEGEEARSPRPSPVGGGSALTPTFLGGRKFPPSSLRTGSYSTTGTALLSPSLSGKEAGAVAQAWPSPWRLVSGILGLGLAALVLWFNLGFILQLGAAQAQGAAIVRQLAETAAQPGPEAGRIYVNVPPWLALKTRGYLLGHYGMTMIPEYVGLGRSVYVHRGVQPDLASLTYPEVAPVPWGHWDYFYSGHGPAAGPDELERAFRKGGGVYVTRFAPGRLTLEYVGRVETGTAPPPAPLARFGDWAVLERAAIWKAGSHLVISLAWWAGAPAPTDSGVLLRFRGEGAERRTSWGYPLGGVFAPQRWRAGDRIEDRWTIPLPEVGADQFRQICIGFADRDAGVRAPATDAHCVRYEADASPVDTSAAVR
ncbi:MAG: hypothetical protein HY689_08040 [Chloroflexi bacterium]|nr:hypothetical protein [Chloroflexota bacterium]